MAEMIPFRYGVFWDVPRFIILRYCGKVLYLQSPFDDELDEYPDAYSVYLVPDAIGETVLSGDWKPLDQAELSFLGQIPISEVTFRFDQTQKPRLLVSKRHFALIPVSWPEFWASDRPTNRPE